jgi:5-dehydro-2-deoxygluconokinase
MSDTKNRPIDVITIGRSSVDLYGQQVGGRIEDMGSFAKYVGGCPANIAIGSARLGLRPALLTRVGDDHMGRFLREQLEREGVNTDLIVSDSERLTALVLLGIRDKDQFPLLFYRENCADMAISEQDVDEEMVARSRAVLITGTHLSQEGVRGASKKAVRLAKVSGAKVIMDVDYRPVLWGLTNPEAGENRYVESEAVTAELQTVITDCDLIVGTEEELHILGGTMDTIQAMRRIRELSEAVIVCKRGALGCAAFGGEIGESLDDGVAGETFEIEVFNVLGAGDAFMSGFLRGWLRDRPLRECCTWANACGALVVSRHGCAPASPSWTELQYFLDLGSTHKALRHDTRLEHVHWATNRNRDFASLLILAIDHRPQLEALAEASGAPATKISRLKELRRIG